jgi:hypothetical protein
MMRQGVRQYLDDQDGLSAGAEALVFGFLVFVIGSIIALNGWAVLDAKFATNAAAREATRSIVEAGPATRMAMVGDDGSDMATGRAYQVVVDTLVGHGKDPALLPNPEQFVVALKDDPWIGGHDRPDRCARVTVEVRYPVAPIRLPLVGGWTTPITVVGQHTELTDPLRSGLRGEATC